jgi:3-deoxy-7-phosphoheptulonate synthase
MIVIMEIGASEQQTQDVIDAIQEAGLRSFVNPGVERKVIACLGVVDAQKAMFRDRFASMPGVKRVELISEPYKLASRQTHPQPTIVKVGDKLPGGTPAEIGGTQLAVIAGPCSVESREQTIETALAVKAAGANLLRGGAFKPRSSPYSFQGLGHKGLEILAEAREATGLPVVTEVMEPQDVRIVSGCADMLQIGARNMQNYPLLKRVGKSGLPLLLKRGPGCKVRDLLMACEYVMLEGNRSVVLCERGITTFEDSTRYTSDINAVPVIKHFSHLPVIFDPSHATGDSRYVAPLARAAIAAGADGLMIEVHPRPQEALSDGPQALTPEKFKALIAELHLLSAALGRKMPS